MDLIVLLLISILILNAILSNTAIKKFSEYLRNINLIGKDANKREEKEIPESFGIPLIFITAVSLLLFLILLRIFSTKTSIKLEWILAYIIGGIFIAIIGFFEDLTVIMKRNKQNRKKKGFHHKYKLVIPLASALPITIVMLERSYISLPFLGVVNIGLLYPLLLVPIGIIGASNATNMLAGLNGLESLLGIITISTLSLYSFLYNKIESMIIGLFFLISLIVFYYYNRYPSKVFPGDSLTYLIGYTIGVMAILGDIEKFALSIFILWFIELVLKARSRFKAESFGKVNPDGTLSKPYKKIYSLTHIFMNGKNTEKDIVYKIVSIQVVICIIMLILYSV